MGGGERIYLFAGGRGRSILTTFALVRKVIKSFGMPRPVIAFVGAASFRDNRVACAIVSSLIRAGRTCRIRRVAIAPENADLDRAREALRTADAVFLSGGDVEIGMQVLHEKGMAGFFRDLAAQGKPFIGVSAGSIMMSSAWVRWGVPEDGSTAELFPCLGIVPIVCDTHAEKDGWEELQAALMLGKDGVPGYGIASGAYLQSLPDGGMEAKAGAVNRYTKRNGKIERQADLLPTEGEA
jgi:peptidase E